MIYKEKTETLRKGLFDIHNTVGLGRNEEAYHQAYRVWLATHGVPFQSKPAHTLKLKNENAHVLYPDFVVWDCITVELKALARHLRAEERVQLFDYLKCRNDRLGLLVNMGLDRVHVDRLVYDPGDALLFEDWKRWNGEIAGEARQTGGTVRQALLDIYEQHGTGYGSEVLEKLIHAALRHNKLSFGAKPRCRTEYEGHNLGISPLDCIIVDNAILLVFTALFDTNQFNLSRGLSFMHSLNLKWGIAANFGKKTLEINGLRAQ